MIIAAAAAATAIEVAQPVYDNKINCNCNNKIEMRKKERKIVWADWGCGWEEETDWEYQK